MMQNGVEDIPANVDRAVLHRREVLTMWGFAVFIALGVIALSIDALISYA